MIEQSQESLQTSLCTQVGVLVSLFSQHRTEIHGREMNGNVFTRLARKKYFIYFRGLGLRQQG